LLFNLTDSVHDSYGRCQRFAIRNLRHHGKGRGEQENGDKKLALIVSGAYALKAVDFALAKKAVW
jgi:hypothetical protein